MDGFIQQTLILIGASILIIPIFSRLGFGSELGYLMAGIIVGPYGLGLLKDQKATMHFAEIGVALLLFIIGLEIQPRKLWGMKHKLIGLGLAQVLVCTLLFGFVGGLFGITGVGIWITALAFSLSSTAFAIQTLTEKNELRTEYGQGAFSILLMQDLVAIPVLALVGGKVP